MKLATFSHGGATRIGVVVEDSIIDLSAAEPELPREMIAFLMQGPFAIDRAAGAAKKSGNRIPLKSIKLEAPIARPPEFLAI
ncbi:MAG TPA: Rv2993c-like domain-containing protein, partial [Candidatus Binatus sp.]|nr:Rv2993c-like domain-containing protein [Candidatus Binatus sp.]